MMRAHVHLFAVALLLSSSHASISIDQPQRPALHHSGDAHAHDRGLPATKDNAFRIFNSIHSSMRQWGSSINHNGFAFIPAVVPRGTLLYHGRHSNTTPTEPEWLAFEPEHARVFATSRRPGPIPMPPGGGRPPSQELRRSTSDRDRKRPPPHGDRDGSTAPRNGFIRGYLHTYQASRDLRLLYLDGMAAAKTNMGTLDTQDIVLRGLSRYLDTSILNERERANALCSFIRPSGCDGFIRMEVGFEVIMCDFSDGLDLVSALRQPTLSPDDPDQWFAFQDMRLILVARAASQHYDGISGGRVRPDYSFATSGLFYPVNISSWNPDRPDLLRIGSASDEETRAIRSAVRQNILGAWERLDRGAASIDWQAVADMIVTRYSSRIAALASGLLQPRQAIKEIREVISSHVDYPPEDDDIPDDGTWPVSTLSTHASSSSSGRHHADARRDGLAHCEAHHLLPATIVRHTWTQTDRYLAQALGTVMGDICRSFFAANDGIALALAASPHQSTARHGAEWLRDLVQNEAGRFRELQRKLAWTSWVRCEKCQANEMCFIAMWPLGTPEDHWKPQCRNATSIRFHMLDGSENYWGNDPM